MRPAAKYLSLVLAIATAGAVASSASSARLDVFSDAKSICVEEMAVFDNAVKGVDRAPLTASDDFSRSMKRLRIRLVSLQWPADYRSDIRTVDSMLKQLEKAFSSLQKIIDSFADEVGAEYLGKVPTSGIAKTRYNAWKKKNQRKYDGVMDTIVRSGLKLERPMKSLGLAACHEYLAGT